MESLVLFSAVLTISIFACSGMPRTFHSGAAEARENPNWGPPGILKKLENSQGPWRYAWAKLKAERWQDAIRRNGNKHWKTRSVNKIEKAPWADQIPDQENCGLPDASETVSEYIIGGKDSSKLKYPWMVQVLAPFDGPPSFPQDNECSGVIISKQWVLTAKHCVVNAYIQKKFFQTLPDKTSVAVVQSSFVKAGLDEETVPVDMVMLHPPIEFTTGQAPSKDVALLHLKEPLTFGPKIRSICLPGVSAPEVSPGTRCSAAGWGIVSENPNVNPKVLQEVELPIVDRKTCEAIFKKNNNTLLSPSAICAGGEGPSTCYGDSGGPLMCTSGGRYYVTGVTASGVECGVKGLPVAFMETSKFVEWIYKTMQKPKDEIVKELVQ